MHSSRWRCAMEDADAFLWSVWNLERGRGRWLVTRLLVCPFPLKRFRREHSTSLTVRASNVARIGQLRAQMLPELRTTLNLPGQAHAKKDPHTPTGTLVHSSPRLGSRMSGPLAVQHLLIRDRSEAPSRVTLVTTHSGAISPRLVLARDDQPS